MNLEFLPCVACKYTGNQVLLAEARSFPTFSIFFPRERQ
jgi:hypothetical protein